MVKPLTLEEVIQLRLDDGTFEDRMMNGLLMLLEEMERRGTLPG